MFHIASFVISLQAFVVHHAVAVCFDPRNCRAWLADSSGALKEERQEESWYLRLVLIHCMRQLCYIMLAGLAVPESIGCLSVAQ